MTHINPYLRFDGNCREAMTFYKDCLGGELTLMTVESSPLAEQMLPDAGQNIMHSCLTNGNLVLMASDIGPGARVNGNNVSLMLNCSSKEEVQRFFSHLAAGGEVSCPLGEAFWGATFGNSTDKKAPALKGRAIRRKALRAYRQTFENTSSVPETLLRPGGPFSE